MHLPLQAPQQHSPRGQLLTILALFGLALPQHLCDVSGDVYDCRNSCNFFYAKDGEDVYNDMREVKMAVPENSRT